MDAMETRMAQLSEEKRQKMQRLLEKRRKSQIGRYERGQDGGYTTAEASFAQQRLWFFDQLTPGSDVYTTPIMSRLRGELQVGVLERALQEVVNRHESLRTTFASRDGFPVQRIASEQRVVLPITDLTHVQEPQERELALREVMREEVQRPFDLAGGPLVRFGLVRLGTEEHVLMATFHHIIFDGWSNGLFWQELTALYAAFANGLPSPLPELPIQYADYAMWQRESLLSPAMEAQVQFWREQLAGVPTVVELPTDHPAPAESSFRGQALFGRLPLVLLQAVQALGRREQVTDFMTLLAAYAVMIGQYSGMEEFLIGTASANRDRLEIEGLIGFFANLLPLRIDLSGNPSFRELLQRVKGMATGAFAHANLPFERLVEIAQVDRDAGRTPLVQVTFNMPTDSETLRFGGLEAEWLHVEFDKAPFSLMLDLAERSDGLALQVLYDTEVWEEASIWRMIAHFQLVLEQVVANPDLPLAQLSLLTEAERQEMLVEWNDTCKVYPEAELCLHTRFEEVTARQPDATAVVFAEKSLTYRELNERANQVAHALRSYGVGREQMVSLCVDRSLEMIIGVLGILKAGAAYVPIDPSYPADRIAWMVEDTQSAVILTEARYAERFQAGGAHVLLLDQEWASRFALQSRENLGDEANAEQLAYVIFTSGSTGRPKGVMIEHRAASHFISGMSDALQIRPDDRLVQFGSLSFDVSVADLFTTLLSGAELYLGTREQLMSPEGLTRLMQEHRITAAFLPPVMTALLDPTAFPDLQRMVIGGEAYAADLVNRWNRLSRTRFFNGYGPTETTVIMTLHECQGQYRQIPPMGRPMANHVVYVLDRHMRPVPVGVRGELYIGGSGVARGYLQRPDLTAEKFVDSPFQPGMRLYKTGDVVRWLPGGLLEYVGRADNQVKIRGFRIELGEVEGVLHQHPAVKQAVVIVREDLPGGKGLVAYLVPHAGAEIPAVDALSGFLAERVPGFMIPAAFVPLEEMPITPNGKLDRRALPAPQVEQALQGAEYVAPRTRTEAAVAAAFGGVLQREQVGILDHFFNLGGHSLLATQLVARLEGTLGVKVPLRTLFTAPTVRELAQAIEREMGDKLQATRSSLVALSAEGNVPLFCVHPVGGSVFAYVELARLLGDACTFYGLEAAGLDGVEEPLEHVAEMAARYVAELLQVQPQGPYHLAGWSMGGVVAFEMAKQLQATGADVALLVLIDTVVPDVNSKPGEQEVFAAFATDFAGVQGVAVPEREAELPGDLQQRFRVFRANVQAMFRYQVSHYTGRVALVRAEEHPLPEADDLGWSAWVSGGVEVSFVPGDHYTMLKAPQVTAVAERLRTFLKKG